MTPRHHGGGSCLGKEAFRPRYNIAPTQNVAAVRLDSQGKRQLALLHWGLIPSWAKDTKIG